MTQELTGLGISFERFEAIDAAAAKDRQREISAKRYGTWAPSEVGCLLSHSDIWAIISQGCDEYAIVMEDDLHFEKGLRRFLNHPFPSDADIIKLETVGQTVRTSWFPKYSAGGTSLYKLHSLHTGSGAYAISRQAAAHLDSQKHNFDLPVDHILFEPFHPASHPLTRYQCVPGLVRQDVILPPHERVGGSLETGMTDRPVFHAATSTSIPPNIARRALTRMKRVQAP
tara:strand:- start:2992 stop:3675 length:684 start_codon:yes stop_codon:yes gene_type:complete